MDAPGANTEEDCRSFSDSNYPKGEGPLPFEIGNTFLFSRIGVFPAMDGDPKIRNLTSEIE
jgi:hypothetical protein